MTDEGWIDISHIGNPAWEEQLDASAYPTARYRHRRRRRRLPEGAGETDWTPGPAPKTT